MSKNFDQIPQDLPSPPPIPAKLRLDTSRASNPEWAGSFNQLTAYYDSIDDPIKVFNTLNRGGYNADEKKRAMASLAKPENINLLLEAIHDANCIETALEFIRDLIKLKIELIEYADHPPFDEAVSRINTVLARVIENIPELEKLLQTSVTSLEETTNLTDLEINQKELKKKSAIFAVLQDLLPFHQEQILALLERNQNILKKGFRETPDSFLLLSKLLLAVNKINKDDEAEAIKCVVNEVDIQKILGPGIALLAKSHEPHEYSLGKILLEKIYTQYGIQIDGKIFQSLTPFNGEKNETFLEDTISSMRNIEEQRHGAVQALNRQFNIVGFGRHPVELLIKQFDEREKTDLPYGVIITARQDRNGAYASFNSVRANDVFLKQLDGHCLIRIVECGTAREIIEALVKLNRAYGERQKISFAIIRGHGTPEDITLGSGSYGKLTKEQLTGTAPNRIISNFFVNHPTIILDSCSTGESGGIAESMADQADATIYAPKYVTQHPDIDVKMVNGSPIFTVDFREAETMKYDKAA